MGAGERGLVHKLSVACDPSHDYTLIEQEVRRANEQLGRVEQVEGVQNPQPRAGSQLAGEAVTPTRKIKRSLLQQHFAHLISQMYSDDEEQRINRQLVH